MLYYIFVVNDIVISDDMTYSAEEVVKKLLDNKVWLFTPYTPNLKKFKKGDKALVYLAGKNRRFFAASFELGNIHSEVNITPNGEFEEFLFGMYNLSCNLYNIEVWQPNVPIVPLKDKLEFIIDKKNWGLFFRQSTKVISKRDYDLIVSYK